MPQHITAKEAAQAALTYYNHNLLGFQHAKTYGQCSYVYPGSAVRCAIGAILNDETLAELNKRKDKNPYVSVLVSDNIITVGGKEELRKLAKLQNLHD